MAGSSPWITGLLLTSLLGLSVTGCASHQGLGSHHQGPLVWNENPMLVPPVDREILWNQLVDTIDDYFVIEREERIRQVGNVLTEGRIDTFPEVGATLLEPWRRDSTKGFERRFATLQSVRRRASVRAWPAESGYRVEVIVLKELEDVQQLEFSPVGGEVYRHDGTLVRGSGEAEGGPHTLGWIPLGRDVSLEQQILAEIRARLETS